MITPIASAFSPQAAVASQTSSSSTSSAASTTQDMFLQLLVAQLQNQDPTQPMDSTTFITQLAQIQQLEQSTATGQDVSAMHTDLDTIVADLSSSTSSQS
jgi:flagellar basal-body rod modification protein FlgD